MAIKNQINTYADLTAYNADLNKDFPNISYIQGTDEVKWNKYDPDHIVAVYNVTSTSEATKLLGSSNNITYQIIDGVIQQSVQTTYTFDTLGEHIVKYKLSGTVIGIDAFNGCGSITSVTIPSGVTSIDKNAFMSTGLTSFTLPSSVTSIGLQILSLCNSLTTITVDSGNTTFDSRDNCNAIIETSTNTLVQGCKTTVIPNTVTTIGNNAFRNYSIITSITIPNSVTSIGNGAFGNCSGIRSITIPSSVTSIGNEAFNTAGTGFLNFTIMATTPPTLGTSVFYPNGNRKIYVPAESVDAYKAAANWSTYASKIQAIP